MPVSRKMLRKYEASLVWSISRHDLFQTHNSICTPPPAYKKWRTIWVGAGATAITWWVKEATVQCRDTWILWSIGAVLVQEQGEELRVISLCKLQPVLKNRQWSAFYQWTFYEVLGGKRNWTWTNRTLMATSQWWNRKAKPQYPEAPAYRSSRGSQLEIRDG